VANYTITGNPSPNCKGDYNLAGTYDDKPYYTRIDSGFSIWWDNLWQMWLITVVAGSKSNVLWYRDSWNIVGSYNSLCGSGNPIVALGQSVIPNIMKHYRNMRTK